jgi:anti-sigma regulatory factor (Ser/Thr protein kinase)
VSGASVPTAVENLEAKRQLGHVFAEICFAIPSKETAVVSAVEMVRRGMEMLTLDNDWICRVELCLQEALLNAHFHGNHGDSGRTIQVSCFLSAEKIDVHVEDEGAGYELNGDFSRTDTTSPRGRGLFLIRQLMDSVTTNRTGSQIVMSLAKESSYGNSYYAG